MEQNRPLREIALDIQSDYLDRGKNLPYGAVPYVEAMLSLNSIDDWFYQDSADSIVRYALSNLQGWRGETARRVKAELKSLL